MAVQAAAAEETEAAAALARGKRSKLRRAQERYAHQDEEDRQLALEVLAPAGALNSKVSIPARVSAAPLLHIIKASATRPAADTRMQ